MWPWELGVGPNRSFTEMWSGCAWQGPRQRRENWVSRCPNRT
uniref:Uncharacterized protein n=1 Tax=Arundo donax TaxID=35708 RepID=A0A0A8Z5T8_ARUDO